MKLSEQTLTVLKNFTTINQGLSIKSGNTIRTISKQQNVLARATVPDSFSDDAVIFDLNRFLGVVTSLDNPDIDINTTEKKIVIKSGGYKTVYGLSDESMIVAPPAKDLKVENAEVNFSLTKDSFNQVMKLSGVMGLPNVAVVGNGKKITFETSNVKDNESDTFSVEVGDTKETFKFIFNTENLKMIPGNYDVAISSKGIAHFKNSTDPIEYWVATEAGTSYGA
jgi:hypothetical protein